jgi:hypothetical protein
LDDHPDRERHHQMNLFLSRLDEQQRRWYVALESKRMGYGGDAHLARITGMGVRAIRRGRRELDADLADRPLVRIRLPGGGRPGIERRDPDLVPTLVRIVAPETAGEPTGSRKWVRSTLRRLSAQLTDEGHPVSRMTVYRLLKAQGFSLRVNARRKEAKSNHPDREAQFQHIEQEKRTFAAAGEPIISVDTKKGTGWRLQKRRANMAPAA